MSKSENTIALEQVRQELERIDEQLQQFNHEFLALNVLRRKLENSVRKEPVFQD